MPFVWELGVGSSIQRSNSSSIFWYLLKDKITSFFMNYMFNIIFTTIRLYSFCEAYIKYSIKWFIIRCTESANIEVWGLWQGCSLYYT